MSEIENNGLQLSKITDQNTLAGKKIHTPTFLVPVNTGYSLSRADPFHMVCVDINIWEEFIQDTPCRFHHSVCHLWRHSDRISVFLS